MRFSKKIAAVSIVATTILVAGGALAYWTTSGGGSGSASTGTHTAVTVAQTSTVANLVPGSPAQAIDFTITNPASTPQFVTSVAISYDLDTDGAGVDTGMLWNAGCGPLDFTLVQPTVINADLGPGFTPYAPSGASLALDNEVTNQDGCKNQSIVLAFSIVAS